MKNGWMAIALAAVTALGTGTAAFADSTEATTEAEVQHPSGLKIGCAVQTLSNQVWAQ